MTVREAYHNTVEALARVTDEPEAEAQALLAHVLGCNTSGLHLRFLHAFGQAGALQELVHRRLTGMPLAYVLGYKYFYGYKFYVDSRVLIPRWDSECVAQQAIRLIKQNGYTSVADVCCGSGCLGLTLLLETGIRTLELIDISPDALLVAQKNADALVCSAKDTRPNTQVSFVSNDLFANAAETGMGGMYQLIICNPPYVSPQEYKQLDAQIQRFEPKLALWANHNGYEFYERLATQAKSHIAPGGAIVLEIGSTQHTRVMQLFTQAGYRDVRFGLDLANRPRWVSARKG